MTFHFTNATINSMINDLYSENPEAVGFEENYDKFHTFLNTLPKEISLERMSKKDWKVLSLKDYTKAFSQLQIETNDTLKFVWVISSFKVNKLFDVILDLFNEGNFFPTFSLIRTLTEVTCFCNYTLSRCKPFVGEMNLNKDYYEKYMNAHIQLEGVLQEGLRGTKIDILKKEYNDAVEAKQILTAVDFISKKNKYESMRAYYDILCEYVHPNLFSNDVFGVVTQTYPEREPKLYSKERLLIVHGETEKFFLNAPKQEKWQIARYLGNLIKVLDLNMKLFEETVVEFRNVNVELLTDPGVLEIASTFDDEHKKRILDSV